MLEIAVLGLLNESPMHGYELRKRLSDLLGAFRAFSYGSLYPTLRRCRSRVDHRGSARSRHRRGSGARSRRGKRVYRLTAEGKEHFAELLADVGPDAFDDEGFGARLAFFAQTRSDIRLQILEGRRRRVEEQRDGMKSSLARTGRAARPLHPRAARARARVGRPRGPLARRAHRERTRRRTAHRRDWPARTDSAKHHPERTTAQPKPSKEEP